MPDMPIESILVISLSNIGDIILTFPVLDSLWAMYPDAALDVVVGPKGEELLKGNPHINELFIFRKHQGFWETLKWLRGLRKQYYDLIIDLRNTAIPFFLRGGRRTSPFLPRTSAHMWTQHMNRLRSLLPNALAGKERRCVHVSPQDRRTVDAYLIYSQINERPFIAVAPSAADQAKRWLPQRFARLCDQMKTRYPCEVVLLGDREDREVVRLVLSEMRETAVDLSGRLTLPQLGYLLQKSRLLICNDTAPQHLASYLDTPVIALFGPTNPDKYGPWGKNGYAVVKRDRCPACRINDPTVPHSCLEAIEIDDIFNAFTWQPDKIILHATQAYGR